MQGYLCPSTFVPSLWNCSCKRLWFSRKINRRAVRNILNPKLVLWALLLNLLGTCLCYLSLWIFAFNIVKISLKILDENDVYATLCYTSCNSFPICFRKLPLAWAIWYPEDMYLLCGLSPTDLTLPSLITSLLKKTCEFSVAEDNMTSSQLLVNSKFIFW